MSTLFFRDTTVELSTQDECFLTEFDHLILEISPLDRRFVGRINLISRKSKPGIWDADQVLVLAEASEEFMLSVYMETYESGRQLLGLIELNGAGFYNGLGKTLEIPFICHENYPGLILKTKPYGAESVEQLVSGDHPHSLSRDIAINKIIEEANVAHDEFELHGNLESLEQAIAHYQSVSDLVQEDHSASLSVLNGLGTSFRSRFERLGNLADINESIRQLEAAINLTPEGDSEKSMYLNNFGISLLRRFERFGNLTDINDAIASSQTAVQLISEGHASRPVYLCNLGTFLSTRFEHLGDISDIDNAVRSTQVAVDLTPEDHPERPGRLNSLANSLLRRYERFGNLADLNDAITSNQAAVELTPPDHPNRLMYLGNLGASLEARFLKLGSFTDMDNSILSKQAAVDLTPDGHPDKPSRLNNLGCAFETRFQRLGSLTDIENAVTSKRMAVKLMPDDHPDKPACLNNLGISLKSRFEQIGDLTDLDDAISSYQEAVNLRPENHPLRAAHLVNAGRALWTRFTHLQSSEDLESAIFDLSTAASSHVSRPTHRFEAARKWCKVAFRAKHPSLLAACECLVTIMPLVAWLGLSIPDRHQQLVEIGGMTRDVAAAAMYLKRYDKALEWLEQGRSIVWSQILQLRTPVDELRVVQPELAERFVQVSQLLDQGSGQEGSVAEGKQSSEEYGRRYRALTTEWESIIEQIRSLPAFENFLRPLTSEQLMKAVQEGPVVILNITNRRCDALVLVPGLDDIIYIPLPKITPDRVAELVEELNKLLLSSGVRMRGERAAMRVGEESGDDCCKHILAELWSSLVKPILDSLAFSPNPDILPRLWWYPTGLFSFLPIHAAGIYDTNSVDSQLSDYAISSYIPTLSSLLGSSNTALESTFKLLSVIQPSAPGASAIPNTKEELECIRRHVSDQNHVVLEGSQGTKRKVMRGMEECNWLHLACHGVQRSDEPTKSALILEDGHLTLEEIIKHNLPNAQFAFLSACQTTTGDEQLSEEAVHIAGGMLLAGYRGVVATMWSIQDDLAPEVADEFYAHLLQNGEQPDSRQAAGALHYSVQKLRQKRNVPLISWIPFVHLGI